MPEAPIADRPRTVHHPSEQIGRRPEGGVEAALWGYAPLRSVGNSIEVHVSDGLVNLSGHVRSATQRNMAGRLAAAVPGVREVVNQLVADTELEVLVAQALALDPLLADASRRLAVKCLGGRAVVMGVIEAPAEGVVALVKRIEEVAASVAGVCQVVERVSSRATSS